MNKIIKIKAPFNGLVKKITELNDGVFSELMLGDGIYIEPTDEKVVMKSPIDGKVAQVFETNHAIFFKDDSGIAVLVHVGLDTVTLKGVPFKVLVSEGTSVKNTDDIMDIDFEMIRQANISTATPIVIDTNDSDFDVVLSDFKIGSVKKGDTVFSITITEKEEIPIEEIKLVYDENNHELPIEYKNKYLALAEEIRDAIGGPTNYKNYLNCMTRFRFEIINKEKVDQQKLKKLSMVKGLNWAGNQIQIIIGTDVFRVKEAFDKMIQDYGKSNKKVKRGFRTVFAQAVSGILMPCLPVMIAAGLFQALYAILVQTNAITDAATVGGDITKVSMISGILYMMGKVGITFVGMLFCFSTVKYLNGNPWMGVLVGLTIASPYLFNIASSSSYSWEFFKIGSVSVTLEAYPSSLIPQIFGGIIYVFADRWVKSWMPATLDITFRGFISYALTIIPLLFIFGPILGIIESGVFYVVNELGKIPYGFGTMFFAIIWQPLVLTGMHGVIIMPVVLNLIQGIPSVLMTTVGVVSFAQVGAILAVGVKTDNKILSRQAYAAATTGIFGITEPGIYGITLPKIRPFIMSCLGAAIGGLIIGVLDIKATNMAGFGIFGIFSNTSNGWKDIVFVIMTWCICVAAGFVLTWITYKERKTEKDRTKATFKLVNKYILLKGKVLSSDEKNEIEKIKSNIDSLLSKESVANIKVMQKTLSKISKLKNSLSILEEKETKVRNKLISKSRHFYKKEMFDKVVENNKKIIAMNYNNLYKDINTKIKDLEDKATVNTNLIRNLQNSYLSTSSDLIKKLYSIYNDERLLSLKNNFYNGIYGLEINFGLSEINDDTFYVHKKDFNTPKNKKISI